MTTIDFIDKIAWEGGPLSAVEYGLAASDADDPRLGELWQAIADHSRSAEAGGSLEELTDDLYRYVDPERESLSLEWGLPYE
jgi:hypothetical protein